MEKLQRQHDAILKDFRQSRRFLDVELPKIINLYIIQVFNDQMFKEIFASRFLIYNFNTSFATNQFFLLK